MKGLIFNNIEDCNSFINRVWAVIKPPYAPEGTIKPQAIKHPYKDEWCYLTKGRGYYYNMESTVMTQQEIESIINLPIDWFIE